MAKRALVRHGIPCLAAATGSSVRSRTPYSSGFRSPSIGGDEVIHSVLDVMYADAPYIVIQRAMHIHPTVTELIATMLGDLKPVE